ALVTGGIAAYRGRLYVPVSSIEEGTAGIPTYQCCTFRGSVVALDAANGKQIWKTYTIKDEPRQTTKNNRWTQLWGASGGGGGSAHDFSSSPSLTVFPDGRRVLLAGQKSGTMFGLNPESGELIWKTQAGDGGVLGGIEWGFANDGSTAYVSLSNALEKKPGEAGGLVAVGIEDGKQRWTAPPAQNTCGARPGCTSAQPAAVSVIPGVVFSGSLDGHLRAYDSATGRVVWGHDTVL